MKKTSLSQRAIQNFKNSGLLLGYLIIFTIVPYSKMGSFVSNLHCANPNLDKRNVSMFVYVFLFSMFMFIVPYKLARFSNKAGRVIFIIIGLLIPFTEACIALALSGLVCSRLGF
jgi:hypothetical protein